MTRLARHQAAFILLWTATLAVGWRPLVGTLALSLHDDAYTYILLVFPISAALIFLEWRPLLRTAIVPNVPMGASILIVAILISCSALGWAVTLPSDVRLSMRMLALVLSWIGSFELCFGSRAARLISFPLWFLLGLVPLPQLVVHAFVTSLQQGSAWSAHLLFSLFDVPVVQDGVLLTIPGLTLQVAQECSSIRSSSMLLITTMVLAQLLLRSRWRRGLVIGLAVPLSIAKNGLRIFTIAMLGTRVDPGYLTGKLHHQGGVAFFGIALLGIFGLLWILRRSESLPNDLALNPVNPKAT